MGKCVPTSENFFFFQQEVCRLPASQGSPIKKQTVSGANTSALHCRYNCYDFCILQFAHDRLAQIDIQIRFFLPQNILAEKVKLLQSSSL